MTVPRKRRQGGASLLEFTLVGIPLIFLLVSVEELSRGMWIYGTLQHAVKEASRAAIVHGQTCSEASASCPLTVGQMAAFIERAGVGLDPSQLTITLATANNTQSCSPLKTCESLTTAWPPSPDNSVGLPVTISGDYPFSSALVMFWPGAGKSKIAAVNFSAKSQEEIRF
jgi:Flp pilus assembly protein TadG